MKHRIKHNQLARNTKQAKALYRGLVQSLIDKGRIETTQAKAKAVIGEVDHVINLVKENSVNSKRQLLKILGNGKMFERMSSQILGKMDKRTSGYSRIIKLGKRGSDNAEMVLLELVDIEINSTPAQAVVAPVEQKSKKPEIQEGEIVKETKVTKEAKVVKTKKQGKDIKKPKKTK